MPVDLHEAAQRIAVCRSDDRVRGLMFNELLALVDRELGADAVVLARASLPPDTKYLDLISYPISDFIKLLYATADLLEPIYGTADLAIRACGAVSVDAFARTPSGKLFFGVLGIAGPARLLSQAQTGYTTVVTYGQREFLAKSDTSGVVVMKDDMQPLAYHEGVLEAVLRSLGYDAVVRGRSLSLVDAEYDVSWQKREG